MSLPTLARDSGHLVDSGASNTTSRAATFTTVRTDHHAGGAMPVHVAEGFRLEAAMANAGLTWTKERIERLKELWTEGLSASQIAAELGEGVSRNAMLGKAHRLGLAQSERREASTPRPRKPTHPSDQAPAVEPPPQNDPHPAPMMSNQAPAEPAELPRREEAAVPQSEGVTIMELHE